MPEACAAPVAVASPWTCPFCPLACDHLGVAVDAAAQTLTLSGGECSLASRRLAGLRPAPSAVTPQIDGRPCDLDSAVAAAARLLGASRQPLFGGLGTDVAGARALYPLACATGAICDPAGGDALMHGLRALQDRGQFTTTLAEVRTRADLIVFVGGLPTDLAPLIGLRCGIGDPQVAKRRVVVLGPNPGDEATLAQWAATAAQDGAVELQTLPLHGDLFDTLARLCALVAGRTPQAAPPALRTLADRLGNATYAVLVGTPARLPAQGALLIEAVHRLVDTLNQHTRAAALWIGGGDGAATVNQVFAWLSGLPLRSRAGPRGLEHQPLAFAAHRLLDEAAVDSLLWISSFDAAALPPATALPMVLLGHPAQGAAASARAGLLTVFFPVTTPGIGSAGHLFRTDGTVLMPLAAVYRDGLPSVAEVLGRIRLALEAQRATGQA